MVASLKIPLTCSALLLAVASCSMPNGSDAFECKGRIAGDLVISEFLPDPNGIDEGNEYIEIFNATRQPIDLKGLTLYHQRLDGTREKTHIFGSAVIAPFGYFVVGDAPADNLPAWEDYSYGESLGGLNNTAGVIGVRCGDTKLDEVRFTSAAKSGIARVFDGSRSPDALLNDDEGLWCDAQQDFTANLKGSPRAANPPCAGSGTTCKDATTGQIRVASPPSSGQLVITELMANPNAVPDTEGEWFEVLAKTDLDLNGLELTNESGKSVLASTNCIHLFAGQHAVFVHKLDPAVNGGITDAVGTFTFSLANSSGSLSIKNGSTLIDRIAYSSAFEGASTQLDPAKLDPTLNDDPASFCVATAAYGSGGDKGTPGTANSPCGGGDDPSKCKDKLSGALRSIVPPAVGDVVISEFMANPAVVADADGEWIELWIRSDVDLNGVEIANEGTGKLVLASPDCLRARGNSFVLLGSNVNPAQNGGLPEVVAPFPFSLGNSSTRSISVRRDGGLLDTVSYSSALEGRSSQLDPGQLDPIANDQPSAWCSGKSGYGSVPDGGRRPDGGFWNLGSPNAPNEPCP